MGTKISEIDIAMLVSGKRSNKIQKHKIKTGPSKLRILNL